MMCSLAAWSALCAMASQIHFPHFLFICEQVEAFYGGMADDAVVFRVMQTIIAALWVAGVVTIVVSIPLARNFARDARRSRSRNADA